MAKIININPFIKHEDAEYFLNIYHDISLKEDRNTKEIKKTLNSLVGHFYVGFASKLYGSEKSFGKGSIEDGNLITDGTAIIGRGRVVDENSRLSLSKKYQAEKGEEVVDTRVIPLTSNQYFNSYQFAKVREQDNNHLYIAGGYDCADFVQSVYHAAGLSFYFTKCYTAQELKSLGTAASMKALLKYSSRDNFVKYFRCITGISAEEIALRLNIEEERVEELAGYKGVITADELDAARKYFSINIRSTDLLLDNQENIDEYFVAYNVLAEDLAKANPFLKEEEKSDLDQQQQEGNSRYAEGWQDACEALSLCHSNAIKEHLKEHNKEELAWLVASPSQMREASKHVSDFFSELAQQQVGNQQVLDILDIVNHSSEIASKEQVSLSQEAWFQDMLEKAESIQTACGEVKNNSLAGNMSLNLGMPTFDLSSFLAQQSANAPSTSQNSIELAGNVTVRSNLMQEEDQINHVTTGLTSRIYHIKELPQSFSLAETINLLGDSTRSHMGIAARFIISYCVASSISKSASSMITARGKKVIEASEKWYSHGNRDLKREAAEWQDINDRVTSSDEKFLTEHWSLMVTSPKESIDIVSQNLITLYNNNNFRLGISYHLQLPVLLSMMPMQQAIMWNILDKFKLTRLVLSKEVIARLPIHAEWKGVPRSGVLLHARRGQLFNFNPFYKINAGNYNICIFAPSGGGKSVFLQELAVSLMAQNTRMFILDIGQSFANICTLLNGEIIQFGRKAPFSLNPFASFYQGMNPDDKDEFLKCTKGLLEVMCGVGDDARGSAELEKAIVAALAKSNYQLDISSFAKFLEDSDLLSLQKYGATLYPYTHEGLYGKYFSGTKQATFQKLITVFEFEEIKNDPKLLSIVLQILLMEVTNQFLTGDRQTPFMIIVDEAWMLLDFATSFFAAFVRTVRKYGGSLVICVQNFMDLHKSQEHRTILENSTWTILLKQDEKALGAFKESEAFKDMIPLIRSISLVPNKYAEALLYTTEVTVIGKLVLDDYSKALFSTDASDFNFLKQKTAIGITLDEAVEQLVEIKKTGKVIRG